MSSNFPTAPDTIQNNVNNSTPEQDTHPNVHNQLADAVMAVENSLLAGGTLSLADHKAAANPHPVYLTQTEGDALYAPIGGGGGGGAPSGPAGGALTGTYPNPTLAANSVATGNIVDGTIAAADMAAGAAASNIGTLGGALTGTLPNPGLAALPANSVGASQITDGSVGSAELGAGAAATNVGTLGGSLTGTLPSPGMAAGAAASNVGALSGVLSGTLPSPGMAAGAAATNVGTLGGALSGTLPNPSIAANAVGTTQIADGSITSAKIQDGTIATADLANQSVTNAKLGTDTARASLLLNGGFEIWQRGPGPFSTNGAYCADGWSNNNGGGTTTVTRETGVVDAGSSASLKIVQTYAVAPNFLRQMLKITDHPQLRGRTLSVSARVQASVANAVDLRFGSDGSGGTTVYTPKNSAVNTWQTLTATYSVPQDATFVLLDFEGYVNCTAYIDNAMLVVGTVPADYAPLHPADDLARCLRYYEVYGQATADTLIATGMCSGTTSAALPIFFRVRKSVTPTVTVTAPASLGVYAASTATISVTTCSTFSIGPTSALLAPSVASGLVTGNATALFTNGGGSVAIEGNP